MTITFDNDSDAIIYALERIVSYARDNRYIFVAQSIWWISSIIGLQQGLVNHIDTLRVQSEVSPQETNQSNTRKYDKEISTTPRDIQEASSSRIESDCVHPDRLSQIQRTNNVIRDHDLSSSESSYLPPVIERTKQVFQKSRKDKKALNKKTDIHS